MNRRRFIQSSLLAAFAAHPFVAATASFARSTHPSKEYFLVCDGLQRERWYPDGRPIQSKPGVFRAWSFEKGVICRVPIPFIGHSIASRPGAPERVFVFEKWGTHAAEIDFLEGRLVRVFLAAEKRRFFGHGDFSRDGRHLFVSQMDDRANRGIVAVIDPQSAKVLDELPSHGLYPHELHIHPERDSLLVLNGRARFEESTPGHELLFAGGSSDNDSRLATIGLADGQVQQEIQLGNVRGEYHHFTRLSDGSMIVLGIATESSLVSFVDSSGRVSRFEYPGPLKPEAHAEALNVGVNENLHRIAVSVPKENALRIFDYRSMKHLQTFPLSVPRGVSRASGRGAFLVLENLKGKLRYLNEEMTEWVDSRFSAAPPLNGRGAHMTRVVV